MSVRPTIMNTTDVNYHPVYVQPLTTNTQPMPPSGGPPANITQPMPPSGGPPANITQQMPPSGPPANITQQMPPSGPPANFTQPMPPSGGPPANITQPMPPSGGPPANITQPMPPSGGPPANFTQPMPPSGGPPENITQPMPPSGGPPANITQPMPPSGGPPANITQPMPPSGPPPAQALPPPSGVVNENIVQPTSTLFQPTVQTRPAVPSQPSQPATLQPPLAAAQSYSDPAFPRTAGEVIAPVQYSTVGVTQSVPHMSLPPPPSQQAQAPPPTHQEPPSHYSHPPQRDDYRPPHEPSRDQYAYPEEDYNRRYYDNYDRGGGRYPDDRYRQPLDYYPPRSHDSRYYRPRPPSRNPYPDHHGDPYRRPYDHHDRYYRPQPQDSRYPQYQQTEPYDPYYGSGYEDGYYNNDPYYRSEYAESDYNQSVHHGDQYESYNDGYPQTQDATNQSEFNPVETTQSELNPAETSVIPGQMSYFEEGQTFINSPQARPPAEGREAYTEGYNPQYEGYAEGYDPQYASYLEGYDNTDQGTEQPWEAVQTTPPPTPRQTPELFVHPHVRASFGFGGQLVTILPKKHSHLIEISLVKDLMQDDDIESKTLDECVKAFPGPFLPGSTSKSTVVQYACKEMKKVQEKVTNFVGDSLGLKKLEDEALLWEFLLLLCRQNGVILPTDISDLLVRDSPLSVNSSLHLGTGDREEALSSLRDLLLAGQRKDALELACSRCLWGHALMLADEQSRNYVVNRFTASLSSLDPLGTFYTLLLGRMPSAVKVDGLQRAGDWRQHLAMVLANRLSQLDTNAIVSMGDALLNRDRLHAAHLCYFLGDVRFGCYGDQSSKYTLLGVDASNTHATVYPNPQNLRKMEVFEYAMSLSKKDFSLPGFQMYKFLFTLKLLEVGYTAQALRYCEQIGTSVAKGPKQYTPVFLNSLVDVSVKLHHLTSPYSVVENELPSWLANLDVCVREIASSDYTPHVFSPSPAFSSVSQTYGQQNSGQVFFGNQNQFLTLPTMGGGAKESEEVPTSEVGHIQPPPPTQEVEMVNTEVAQVVQEDLQPAGVVQSEHGVLATPTSWEGVAYNNGMQQEDTLAGECMDYLDCLVTIDSEAPPTCVHVCL